MITVEFGTRMVGCVPSLTEWLVSLGYEQVGVSPLTDEAEAALARIKERHPHFKLQHFGPANRPDLLQRVIRAQGRFRQFAHSPKPEVRAIEFEDDQQVFEFKMRWARRILNIRPATVGA